MPHQLVSREAWLTNQLHARRTAAKFSGGGYYANLPQTIAVYLLRWYVAGPWKKPLRVKRRASVVHGLDLGLRFPGSVDAIT
jgi:hypothetical protein